MLKISAVIFSCLLFFNASLAQTDSLSHINYKKRKIVLASTSAAITVGSLIYLDQAWYQQYSTGRFHFFNDDGEWLQMDKIGHSFTTYQVGRLMMGAFKRAGYTKKQQLWIGGTTGLAYMTVIECLDGLSSGWGFSPGDEVANLLGASLAISQQALWDEQRIQLKFSYVPSKLAKYNPSLLGENFYTQILKDYNAQTYWLSVNPSTFMNKNTRFPKWLNVAFGYSAYGMLGGFSNNIIAYDKNGAMVTFERQRRIYLSVDLDLTRIKTKSKFLRGLFSALNMIKIPAPSLQLSNSKLKFYYLH